MKYLKFKYMLKELWIIALLYLITASIALLYRNIFCIEMHAITCIIFGIEIEAADRDFYIIKKLYGINEIK